MNKQQESKLEDEVNDAEHALPNQLQIVQEFFRRDSASEMIESLHMLVEDFLFMENLARVTPEMRVHIVNNLRTATFIAKLARKGSCP
ncbi:hypothetical protein [Dyadobacter sp. CY323]|uniref:hypothetical protein n=1 Tax=Dyadobacter sp. CY323 TaxID=2907302 RepID=UPI001F446F6B|nr:hypothetical protein [Dyadobacter sp. CY323]MCE6988478.1 hypothetical protein [Dyadobacter sp. CY323]